MGASHEPNPLIPSFSPSGGEGARRADEGNIQRFIAPIRVRNWEVFAFHEQGLPKRRQALECGDGVCAIAAFA
jgi:hypothetical protein